MRKRKPDILVVLTAVALLGAIVSTAAGSNDRNADLNLGCALIDNCVNAPTHTVKNVSFRSNFGRSSLRSR